MIKISGFYCPIAPAESPYTARADAEVMAWLSRFEIYKSKAQCNYFAQSRFTAFPGKSLPNAREHLLALPGKEVTWLWSFDDVHNDESSEEMPINEKIILLGKLTRIMEDPNSRLLMDNPWANALRDLRLEVAKYATPVQVERWVQANIEYFTGSLWEAVNRMEGEVPSLDDYVTMYLKQCAIYPTIVFTDIACGYELPAAEWSDPRVRLLREMASVMIGWDNDLTSYDKEVYRASMRGYPEIQNMISILQSNLQCCLEEAVSITEGMRDRTMVKFLKLRDELVAEGSETLTAYAKGIGQWIRGYLDYSTDSPRYTDPCNSDDASIRHPVTATWKITDTPGSQRNDLPDLPTLSWWN